MTQLFSEYSYDCLGDTERVVNTNNCFVIFVSDPTGVEFHTGSTMYVYNNPRVCLSV